LRKAWKLAHFNFRTKNTFFTAGRDELRRISLIVELDYPHLTANFGQMSQAFSNLTHTEIPEDGSVVDQVKSGPQLLANMESYGKASQVFGQAIISEMIAAGHRSVHER
jgi:hypothetical protein